MGRFSHLFLGRKLWFAGSGINTSKKFRRERNPRTHQKIYYECNLLFMFLPLDIIKEKIYLDKTIHVPSD